MSTSSQNSPSDAFAVFFESTDSDSKVRTNHERVDDASWETLSDQEGKLAVDIFENKKDIVVYSTMAGAIPEKIEVYVHDDVLTIRGERPSPVDQKGKTQYVHKECYWGAFSRTIVLPVDVKGEKAAAEYKNGVLKITIPKRTDDRRAPIKIVEE